MTSRQRVLSAIAHEEPDRLKREFGRDITFWGGGVDTRAVLNHGRAGLPSQVPLRFWT